MEGAYGNICALFFCMCMTINEVINYINEYHPNTVSVAVKLRWINEAEAMVQRDIMLLEPREPYESDDMDKELLAPMPYDRLYTDYLDAMLFKLYHEYENYENARTSFGQALGEFSAYYADKHHPQRRRDYLEQERRRCNHGECHGNRHNFCGTQHRH